MKCKNVLIGDVESCQNTARKILIMFNECYCNNHPANDVQIIILNTFSLVQSFSLSQNIICCIQHNQYIDVGNRCWRQIFAVKSSPAKRFCHSHVENITDIKSQALLYCQRIEKILGCQFGNLSDEHDEL